MSVDQIPSRPRRTKNSLNTTIVIAISISIAVIGFAILHVIGGTIVQRQSPAVPLIEGSAVHGD
jgi:hypothetical protein